jgi:hypothetical protein
MAENEAAGAPSTPQPAHKRHREPSTETGGKAARIVVFAAYRQMLITVLAALGVIILLLMCMFFAGRYFGDRSDPSPSITLSVIVCGALGAMFSAATRLYTFRGLPAAVIDTTTKRLGSGYLFAYSLLPILIGAISAAVIYVGFLSGLFKGGLFPEFGCHVHPCAGLAQLNAGSPAGSFAVRMLSELGCRADTCTSFADLIWNYGPKASEDFAKCLIWGFIAGFAERLVPDALQRLAAKVNNDPVADASEA